VTRRPLAVDLFCGLGGWTEGLLAEGYEVVGFDNERHRYPMVRRAETAMKLEGNNGGKGRKIWTERPIARLKDAIDDCEIIEGWQEYHAQLVLQDVLTLHGSQFRNAALIVASPPCQVVEQTIRREIVGLAPGRALPRGVQVIQYIGISWDERSRAFDVERRMKRGWKAVFPLLERQWTRADCREFLSHNVPHEVPKSACVFCPFHDNHQWAMLKARGGKDWDRIVQIDTALRTPGTIVNRNLEQSLYLHRSCKPITEIDFENSKQASFDGFLMECQGVCGV